MVNVGGEFDGIELDDGDVIDINDGQFEIAHTGDSVAVRRSGTTLLEFDGDGTAVPVEPSNDEHVARLEDVPDPYYIVDDESEVPSDADEDTLVAFRDDDD